LNNDNKIRDRVLFINTIDADFQTKFEDFRFDSKGYFLIDIKTKPAIPLTEGLPLSYEVKEKEIDFKD